VEEKAELFPTQVALPHSVSERIQQNSVATAKAPTRPVKSIQTPPAPSPVPSTSSIAALKKLKVWTSERLVIVSAIVLLLFGLAGCLIWPGHQKAANLGHQPKTANIKPVIANPEALSKPAEPKLTDQEAPATQVSLGLQYERGEGVLKDLRKAAEFFQKAADQGNADAQCNLGWLYENGWGVPKDFAKAEQLYRKAADQGNRDAIASLKRLSKPAEPNQGDAATQFSLAVLYEHGLGVPKDLWKAADLYQKAAAQGHAGAQTVLGWLYEHGEGVPKDLWKAADLYQKAAAQGHAGGQTSLGLLYEHGQGVSKDLGKAAELYQKAADQGNTDAQCNLGWLYENGWGVPKDFAKAEQLYRKAADQGNQAAKANLKRLSRLSGD